MKLRLEFTSTDGAVVLDRVEFSHPLLDSPHRCERGRQAVAAGSGSFFWSRAVRALCLLFVESALNARREQPDNGFILCGGRQSLAQSLAYAIAKKPLWLLDMFGIDSKGCCILPRYLRLRDASKISGETTIALSRSFSAQCKIDIFLNGVCLSDYPALCELRTALAEEPRPAPASAVAAAPAPTEPPDTFRDSTLCEKVVGLYSLANPRVQRAYDWYIREALQELRRVNPLCSRSVTAALRCIVKDGNVLRLAGKRAINLAALSEDSSAADLGVGASRVVRRFFEVNPGAEFRVALSPMLSGALAIFRYFRLGLGMPIELSYDYPQTVFLCRAIGEKRVAPDLVVLSIASAANLLSDSAQQQYAPIALLPSFSHAVIASRKRRSSGKGMGFYMSCESPATPHWIFTSLVDSGKISATKAEANHLETWELSDALRAADEPIAAVRAFPYYLFNLNYDGARRYDGIEETFAKASILFAKRDLCENPEFRRMIACALTDAWLTLASQAEVLNLAMKGLFEEPDFVKCVFRFTGSERHLSGAAQESYLWRS